MAQKIKKKVSRIKTKKKIWFKIIAPKSFGMKEIGETYLPSAETAIGRTLEVNLRDLTGNVKDQNAKVNFRLVKAEGHNLHSMTIGYSLVSAFIKRLVRKNSDRLDDFFKFKSKDGKEVILKTITITRNKSQRSVKTALRAKLHELLKEEFSKLDFSTFVINLVNGRLRSTLKKQLHKITPVKEVTVRVLKLVSDKKVEKEVTLVKEEKKTEVKEEKVEESETPTPAKEDSKKENSEVEKKVEEPVVEEKTSEKEE